MGYVVLHIEKAAGTDAAMSGHVERRITPANVITTLTYLNQELIEFPKDVTNRTEAIQHRLDNAGLERKIGKNQVRALRVMLSGSPEDMKRIRQAGQLDAWAKDSCGWLQKTFGKENVVSAVLHLDEKTPHIHATVVPITRGERRKAKLEREKNAQSGKRTYRTKKDRPRLCADDVMARDKLKAYQTTYAEAMAKYGLQRGIDGSEAKHISTQQYYREVFVRKNEMAEQIEAMIGQKETLTVDIAALQAQQKKLTAPDWAAIDDAAISSYINDDTSSPEGYTDPWKPEYNSDPTTSITVKWDEGASNEEKLERIITQKWIANFPLSTEAWADYRRTGYPKLFRPKQNLAPSIIDTQLGPRRLLYNETELSSNTVEVNNAIQLLKAESSEVKGDGDTGGTRLWWDRKDKGNF